jgi:outer membrane protein insertion porin family
LLTQQRDAKGLSAIWGVSIGDFGTFSFSYGYEDVFAKFAVVRTVPAGEEPRAPHRRPLPPPYPGMPAPALYFEQATGVTSAVTPAYGYDSRDDPFDPNQGVSAFTRLRAAGGILGGDFNYWRPEAGVSVFHPLTRRVILAANLEGGWIRPFSGSRIPLYDRYFLGGERSLRGFSYYSVVPRKANGDFFLTPNGSRMGGDRYLQLNLEYQIKLGGPLKLIFFSDIGNTWHEQQGWQLGLLRYSAGAELRITLPIFQAPLRFIYGVNLKPFPDEKRTDFQFSIGSTF